jgi:gliding motility-associated lipoprotein GldD
MMMVIKGRNRLNLIMVTLMVLLAESCGEVPVPRPKGYFRIDLPEKHYAAFNDDGSRPDIPLRFEYPSYGTISSDSSGHAEPGWFNIEFPRYKARIYLTYKDVNGDLGNLVEQTYTMNVKNHITKADAINEAAIYDRDKRIFGILYDLKGNTATAVQFYATDSTRHYLRGSLYFESEPNADSLAPVIDFFRKDIVHLIETLKWK